MYCRHCGNEIEDDSRFCPYCGEEVKVVGGKEESISSTNVPNEEEAEQVPPPRKTKRKGVKKLVLAASIVLGLATLGVGISALANNVKVNKKSSSESIKATATPTPTKAPTKAPTKTPTPTKVPTINDVAMLIYGAPVELETEHKVVRIQLVENDYDGKLSLVFEIEDTSIVSCEWGEWAKDNTIPLRIYPEGIGETTIKISLADSNVYKEIRVISNYDPAMEAVADAGYTFSEFTKEMYAKASVNVRNLPSTDGKKLGGLEEGEVVKVLGQCNETSWYRIVYNGQSAYVSGNYLLEKEISEEPEATATPKPTEKAKATATPKPTGKPKATATPKPSVGTYTKKSVLTGKTISANPGTGTVVYMEEGRADESVIVPDFEAWNEGMFTGSSESRTTYMSFQKRAGKTPDLDVAEAYIKLLKDEYGFSVKQTADQDPDWIGDFEYIWECTKNGVTMEISLFGLTEMPEYFTFECTKDFLFIDLGNRLSENNEKVNVNGMNAKGTPKTYSVTTTCAVLDGFAAINTSTWIDNHLMGFVLSPDYEKGKILDQSEFEKYSMLTAYKCYAEFIYASGDKGFISTHEDFEDQIEDIKVEILDTKNGYPAVYFYAQIVDDAYTRYYIEGILAPGEDDIMPTTSSGDGSAGSGSYDSGYTGSVPSYGGTSDCIYCENGYVDCMTCNGKGSYTCKVCKGVGSVSHYGYTSDCSCTNGIQYCTNPYCNGGKKKCNICGGRGYK